MNSSNRLLDLYMQKLSLRTLNEVANKLGVTRPAVSNWRAGTSHPNAEAIEMMCKGTGEPLSRWLPLIEAERCRTEGDRKVWLRLAQAAAAVTLAIGIAPKHASTVHAAAETANGLHGYTLCEIRRARRWIGTALAW